MESETIKLWVEAAFVVHHNMRSHTGAEILMVKGAVYYALSKHKLNVNISTEAETVGVDDLMPQNLLMHIFLEAQGFKVLDNIVHLDKQNSIKWKITVNHPLLS